MGHVTAIAGGPVAVDLEAGTIDAAGLKAAALVSESFYDQRELARVDTDLSDYALDSDTSRTRASRDRDRAYPRDASDPSPRKVRVLPSTGTFRTKLSARQRRERSAAKNRVRMAAPATQAAALEGLIGDEYRWADLNTALSSATGNAQRLEDADRQQVQRVDRLIQAYENTTDRGHLVYVIAALPADAPITSPNDVPITLHPGAHISFDQFTAASHTLAEAKQLVDDRQRQQPDSDPTIILEIQTARGLYLGRSDTADDTSHLLPRGIGLRVNSIDPDALYPTSDGGHESTLVVQLTDAPRDPDYTPPNSGRAIIRHNRSQRAARQKGSLTDDQP